MQFTLFIELGNETMRTPSDVSRLLRALADTLQGDRPYEDLPSLGGTLRDESGNRVAHWEVAHP